MYVFTSENMSIAISETQIRETTLYKEMLCIELFNKTKIRIDGKYEELLKMFTSLKKKSKLGNFINTVDEI